MAKPLHTRTRELRGASLSGSRRKVLKSDNSTVSEDSTSVERKGKQITVSEGHQWPPPKGAQLTDRGGPFYTERSYCESGGTIRLKGKYDAALSGIPSQWWYYDSEVSCNPFRTTAKYGIWPSPLASSNGQLDAYGATAIARCEPTNSLADLSTALGELAKEGLPSIPGTQAWKAKTTAALQAGGEYLNVVFGWLPMVGEVNKLAGSVKHADEIIAQYERDSGRVVRRDYEFPTEHTSVTHDLGTLAPSGGVPTESTGVFGQAQMIEEKIIRRWFSGAFTYYLPSDYDSRKKVSEYASVADKMFGTAITPETLWNLAPWSWAVDWFSNVGDVVSNVSSWESAGLVMRYGYMMEHTVHKYTYMQPNVRFRPPFQTARLPRLILITETKKRQPANPFGFGVSWDGLSSFQASVLAALGISRSR